MRIALISEHASPLAVLGGADAGGQNVYVGELATALARQGQDVRVYTRRDDPDRPEVAEYRSGSGQKAVTVPVEQVPAGPAEVVPKDELLPYMEEFGRWLEGRWAGGRWAPDVVHAHFWMSGLAALAATRELDVPVVQTFHALGSVKRRYQGADDTSPPERIERERFLASTADRVIAQCTDEVFELVQLGASRDRMAVVPPGVDLDRFTPDGPAEPRDPVPRILAVGRLVRRKGFDVLIRALRWVPEAELVIVGGGPADRLEDDPEAVRLRATAVTEQVAHRVRLVGGVSNQDMPAWYRSADLLATTPWYEPFGITPLEAMATGLPVVASAVGGLVDTVRGGVTGVLVPPDDPAATGSAIRRLLTNPELRDHYRSQSLRRAHARYSWARTGTEMVRVYREVLGDRSGSDRAAR